MRIQEVYQACRRVVEEVERVIVGKRGVIEKLLIAILSRGHVLIEDYPGLAKTLMAKTLAQTMGLKFRRVQFTPDLLPADITGTYVYNQKTGDFELRKGPIFTNILLADEINRAPPKTQSALLEAMQERQVTLDGKTHRLEE
ncbi:MAG: magnesium chelatase, partial [Thermoprotei archaeon]